MAWFLDTNVIIDLLRRPLPVLQRRIASLSPEDLKIASIVKAELLLGAEKSAQPGQILDVVQAFLFPYEIVPFGDASAREYATIRAAVERKGTPIGPNDLILAATVLSSRGMLVTRNTKEFRRVPGLDLEDWVSERS